MWGGGTYTHAWAQLGAAEVIGVDFPAPMVQADAERFQGVVCLTFQRGDAVTTGLTGGCADERFADPAVQKTIAVDLTLIAYDNQLLSDLEPSITKTARQHDANTRYLLQTVPGIGKILGLVRRYEIHDIHRFPSMQDCASSCRRRQDSESGKQPKTAHRSSLSLDQKRPHRG